MLTALYKYLDLECDINDVKLVNCSGYELYHCDYAVLDANDFVEVLIEFLPSSVTTLNFVFLVL